MSTAMNTPDSSLMSCLVRMVTPMKREFSVALDVRQFMSEEAYARAVLDQALRSKDERLRQYAEYAETKVFGPRSGAEAAAAAAPDMETERPLPSRPATLPAQAAASAELADDDGIEEMRAKMVARYRGSLR